MQAAHRAAEPEPEPSVDLEVDPVVAYLLRATAEAAGEAPEPGAEGVAESCRADPSVSHAPL